eukprot:1936434-Amphidinium_carterae.3
MEWGWLRAVVFLRCPVEMTMGGGCDVLRMSASSVVQASFVNVGVSSSLSRISSIISWCCLVAIRTTLSRSLRLDDDVGEERPCWKFDGQVVRVDLQGYFSVMPLLESFGRYKLERTDHHAQVGVRSWQVDVDRLDVRVFIYPWMIAS